MTPAHRRPLGAIALATLLATSAACSSGGTDNAAAQAKTGNVQGVTITRDEALHAALPSSIQSSGTVRVATNAPYPPFEVFVVGSQSKVIGLDYDIAQAIGTKLGVKFAFSQQQFDGIIPAIQAGKFDTAMSAMTDTKDRQKVLTFVDYGSAGVGLLVAKGNPAKIATPADLCGRSVSVQSGTTEVPFLKSKQQDCAAAGKGKINILELPDEGAAELSVTSGKAVVNAVDMPVAAYVAKTAGGGGTFEVVNDPAAKSGYESVPYGIGVSKAQPQLSDAIQKALQALVADGTYQKILDHYAAGAIAIPQITQNAGKA